jgi:tetratricopeptide (TPR) repeat protein
MTRLRFSDVRSALPELDELRPLLDHLLSSSLPDTARQWSASAELQTADARLVDSDDLAEAVAMLANREHEHLSRIYDAVGQAVVQLGRGQSDSAASLLLDAARFEEGRNRADRAAAYAQAACRIASSGGNASTAALALRRQARATRTLGRLTEAERLYESGHQLAVAVGDSRGAAEAAIGVGNVLEEQGRWVTSADWYRAALDQLDSSVKPPPETWHAHLNMHVVLRSRGEIEESMRWLRSAEQIALTLGDASAGAFVQNAWGQVHMAKGAFPAAERHFRDALGRSEGPRARVTIQLNLAECLLAQGRTLDAAETAREAEREAVVGEIATKLPEVYRLLGRIAAARGNPDAFVLFEHALELIRDRGTSPLEEAITLQAYADSMTSEADQAIAQDLRERAIELFRTVGVHGLRQTWADSYGWGRERGDEGGPA